ncbi:MAG TPA: 2-oxoglutarate dehydrogenase complex dihydrolipoyllysine-residue succinyltransferase [Candidatus Binatia bacterium]|nr:2-oxoglutarate dehydrogenase complex dihydrolipoyllysine-residue succinyltransferase [Candidatus Binatia bacterium]
MPIELKIPAAGESVSEVEIGSWLKQKGDSVQRDEPVVVLESEKASMELPAPAAGIITEVLKKQGDTAAVGEVIAYLEPGEAKAETPRVPPAKEEPPRVMPAAARELAQRSLSAKDVKPTGPGGRILKEDVLRHSGDGKKSEEREEVVPMTKLRRTIAERLVKAHQEAALLTTFNEVDMSEVMALRKQFGESFQAKHGVKLGFMSFFVKACVEALKEFPEVNAEIRGTNIVYHRHYDIGIAVGTGRGLVVPVLRNAERLSFSEIEKGIGDFGKRAKENKLLPDELQGGTFTISNGGVYGSLLSTPIVNPPQSGVLGMHAIQERPVARDGAVVIRPMMYVALSYDHRIIDGQGAVSFLKRIKDVIEHPARMLIEA